MPVAGLQTDNLKISLLAKVNMPCNSYMVTLLWKVTLLVSTSYLLDGGQLLKETICRFFSSSVDPILEGLFVLRG